MSIDKNLNIDYKSIQNIKTICLEMIDKASSGHPGMALGSAPILHALYTKVLNICPKHPDWVNRDRFILSSGHASSLLYTLIHLSGYKLSIDDLKSFRQLGSKCPGHPEEDVTCGVDASTGPLGQGFAYGVGTAIAERYMNQMYPALIDHYTYVLCGDGDIQEGISKEAMSLAGTLKLNKLIVLFDSNDVQLDSKTNVTYSENMNYLCKAFNWNYIKVNDGEDVDLITKAIKKAKKSTLPTLIEVKTVIGNGLANQGTNKVHGAPAPHEEVVKFREEFGGNPFEIDNEVYAYYKKSVYDKGLRAYNKWNKLEKDADFIKFMNKDYKIDESKLPRYALGTKMATRACGGEILKEIGKQNKFLMGGAADIASSTKASVESHIFSQDAYDGRNIMYGVREQVMGACANAITRYGLKSFASTFFVFSDYMKSAMRLSSISKLPTVYIFSHDSIAVGEDGPTHQPVEQLTGIRSIPGMVVTRPCDGNEARECYKLAYESKDRPYTIVLSRQSLNTFSENPDVKRGAYILEKEKGALDGIIIASGSEVSLAVDLKHKLESEGLSIRLVSMPSINLFDEQDKAYIEEILPKSCKNKMVIEMSNDSMYYKYLGCKGVFLKMNSFGKSAKASDVIAHFGFTLDNAYKCFMEMYNKK